MSTMWYWRNIFVYILQGITKWTALLRIYSAWLPEEFCLCRNKSEIFWTRKQHDCLQHQWNGLLKFKNVLQFEINMFEEHCIRFIYWPIEDPHCLPCIIICCQFNLLGWVNLRCLILIVVVFLKCNRLLRFCGSKNRALVPCVSWFFSPRLYDLSSISVSFFSLLDSSLLDFILTSLQLCLHWVPHIFAKNYITAVI